MSGLGQIEALRLYAFIESSSSLFSNIEGHELVSTSSLDQWA